VGSVGESPASVPAADKARGRRLEVHAKKPVLGTKVVAERRYLGVGVARVSKVIPAWWDLGRRLG
jgi:hypothetical protein